MKLALISTLLLTSSLIAMEPRVTRSQTRAHTIQTDPRLEDPVSGHLYAVGQQLQEMSERAEAINGLLDLQQNFRDSSLLPLQTPLSTAVTEEMIQNEPGTPTYSTVSDDDVSFEGSEDPSDESIVPMELEDNDEDLYSCLFCPHRHGDLNALHQHEMNHISIYKMSGHVLCPISSCNQVINGRESAAILHALCLHLQEKHPDYWQSKKGAA